MPGLPETDRQWQALIEKLTSSVRSTSSPPPPPPQKPQNTSNFTKPQLANTIDHTLLNPTATAAQIHTLCTEAVTHRFRTVCVRPNHVHLARTRLLATEETGVGAGITCVVGFPEGNHNTAAKVAEAQQAVLDGATELDVVMNYELLMQDPPRYQDVFDDLSAVREAAENQTLKIIIETSQLGGQDGIQKACLLACAAGADFVKTSTGFRGSGATVEAVEQMRTVCDYMEKNGFTGGKRVLVKASGGIRTAQDARTFLSAGADRLGVSAGVAIVEGWNQVNEQETAPRQQKGNG